MKDILWRFLKWIGLMVFLFLVFCLGGAVYDTWDRPSPVNGMVGYAPDLPSEAGVVLLIGLFTAPSVEVVEGGGQVRVIYP